MCHPPPILSEKPMNAKGKARSLGQWGEALVVEDLRGRGGRIAAKNFRCRMGEIDIIAEDGTYLVFVEVKLRKDNRFGSAREAVTTAKQRKLRITAELYLSMHPTGLQPRFDVAEIYAPEGIRTQKPDICYIENAF